MSAEAKCPEYLSSHSNKPQFTMSHGDAMRRAPSSRASIVKTSMNRIGLAGPRVTNYDEWLGQTQRGRGLLDTNGAFPCSACGACCRKLGGVSTYAELDRGDGVCRHLDDESNLCRIYAERPAICRISDMHEHFSDHLSWSEFVALNLKACEELRGRISSEGE